MRIVLLTDLSMPNAGGVEVLLEKTAAQLKKQGHEALIISSLPSRNHPHHSVSSGIDIYRSYMGVPEFKTPRTWALFLWYSMKSHRELENIIRDFRPDIINVHFPGSAALYAWWLKRKFNLALVVSFHGNDIQLFPQISTIRRIYLRKLMHMADYVTACSEKILSDAREFYDFQSPGIAIRNGVDVTEFANTGETDIGGTYILAAGRFVRKKGFDLLIRAFALASSKNDSLQLVIAGDGEERETIEKLILELGLNGKVILAGLVARTKLAVMFKNCLFFILPSRQEPLGIVNLEAMAAGKAVIAFAVDGVPEIIDEEVGILVEPEDVFAMGSAILELAANKEKASKLGENGRQRAIEKHSIEATAEDYLQVYKEAGHLVDRRRSTDDRRQRSR